MHNVDALEQTIVKARSHPEALKQHVEFGGEWQTGGGPQFTCSSTAGPPRHFARSPFPGRYIPRDASVDRTRPPRSATTEVGCTTG